MADKADWEQAIQHELVMIQCRYCPNGLANWTREFSDGQNITDVFVCGSCAHEMHITRELPQVVQPEVVKGAAE